MRYGDGGCCGGCGLVGGRFGLRLEIYMQEDNYGGCCVYYLGGFLGLGSSYGRCLTFILLRFCGGFVVRGGM